MVGCIAQVWFKDDYEHKRTAFSFIETDYLSFEAFLDDVASGQEICGNIVTAYDAIPHLKVIIDREPITFLGSVVDHADRPFESFIEEP